MKNLLNLQKPNNVVKENVIIKIIMFIPLKYVELTYDRLAFVLAPNPKKIGFLKQKPQIPEVEEDKISLHNIQNKTFRERITSFFLKNWNSAPIRIARKSVSQTSPIFVGGIVICICILVIRPGHVSAEEYFKSVENIPVKDTMYQRMLKKLHPLAKSGTFLVNVTAILNSLEYTTRSFVLLRQGDYFNASLSVAQLGLNCSTLALSELNRRTKNPEEKIIYSGLQKGTLALSTTLRLQSDTW